MDADVTKSRSVPADWPHDRLTGLADLASAKELIAGWKANWPDDAGPCPIHVMLISVGRIETVNIAYGETTGDNALVEIARRISDFAGDELESAAWIAARVSGGTFLIAARDRCSRERWQWLGEALADAIATPIESPQHDGAVRLWPRIALMRAVEGETAEQMLDHLAQALDAARQEQGRRVVWVAGETARIGISNQQLESDLLAAIDRDEIAIVFQPQYALADDRLTGAEALARWQHPEIGRLGANTLFTLAERTDHVAQLSRHIAERALAEAVQWQGDWRLSVNVTPADLSSGSFAQDFTEVVRASGFPAERVTLEITEQVLLADLEYIARTLRPLKAAGMAVALDDFGAGYSNFRYLKHLPVDSIKLDRSMVEGIAEDPRDRAVLHAMVAMARALDMAVVAEGVEEEAQRAILAEEGVDTYQGFLRSLPLLPEDFQKIAAG
ncbi:EAL domain-containing protein [Qipengyuania sp. MTN3-11]|uniref:EAL domain-containing protein n=1 Tax=Qipengyuania sp. MTN3-11 TaxID=3056557 RepID=UPI0036F1C559